MTRNANFLPLIVSTGSGIVASASTTCEKCSPNMLMSISTFVSQYLTFDVSDSGLPRKVYLQTTVVILVSTLKFILHFPHSPGITKKENHIYQGILV